MVALCSRSRRRWRAAMWAQLLNLAETITNLYAKVQIAKTHTHTHRGTEIESVPPVSFCVCVPTHICPCLVIWHLRWQFRAVLPAVCLWNKSRKRRRTLRGRWTEHPGLNGRAGTSSSTRSSDTVTSNSNSNSHGTFWCQLLLLPSVLTATFWQIENVAIVKWHVTCQAIGRGKCPPSDFPLVF